MNATAKIIGSTPAFTQPTLTALSMNVGTANAASASGAEFPHPIAVAAGGGSGPARLMCGCTRPLTVVDI
jgi:hypothetical protein